MDSENNSGSPWIGDEADLVTIGNARTRGMNPLMVGRTCPFPESNDLGPVGVSMISSMTTKEEGAGATQPRRFSNTHPDPSLTQLI